MFGHFLDLGATSLLYAAAALLIALPLKTARAIPQRLISPAFQSFHLGTGAKFIPVLLLPLFAPHRYIGVRQALFWPDTFSHLGTMLSLSAFAMLVVLAATSLLQTLTKRKI